MLLLPVDFEYKAAARNLTNKSEICEDGSPQPSVYAIAFWERWRLAGIQIKAGETPALPGRR